MVVISALGSTVNSSCELPVSFGTVIDVIPVIAAMIIKSVYYTSTILVIPVIADPQLA